MNVESYKLERRNPFNPASVEPDDSNVQFSGDVQSNMAEIRSNNGKSEIDGTPGGSGADQTAHDFVQTICEADDINKNLFNFGQPAEVSFEKVYGQYDSEDNRTALGKAIGGKLIVKCYKPLFYWTQAIFYYILAIPVGCLLTFAWGAVFGINKLLLVWILQPAFTFSFSWIRLVGTVYKVLIRTMCDPLYMSASFALSRIRAAFDIQSSVKGSRPAAVGKLVSVDLS